MRCVYMRLILCSVGLLKFDRFDIEFRLYSLSVPQISFDTQYFSSFRILSIFFAPWRYHTQFLGRLKNKYTKGEEKKHRWNRKVSLFFHFSVTCGYVLNKYREEKHSFGPLWRRAMLVCNHGNNINETKVQAKLGFETSCSFRWYVSYFTNGISGKFDPDSGTLWMPNKILIRYEFTYQWLRFGWFVIFVKRTNDIGIYAIWW